MILVETHYKTYDNKLVTIVEIFKTWHYYIKDCKNNVFVLKDYNNLYRFMIKKNLSSKQVR